VTAFHTFEPMSKGIDIEGFSRFLDQIRQGVTTDLHGFIEANAQIVEKLSAEGAMLSNGRESIQWDDATLIFVAAREVEKDGGPARALDQGISIERLGRFPSEDGNPIGYLRRYLLDESPEKLGERLLAQLDVGLRSEIRGDDFLSNGFGGMSLHGWLTDSDVTNLRSFLQQAKWKVAKDEVFDGGVREIVRHLSIMLKAAEKRGVGIIMRSHT